MENVDVYDPDDLEQEELVNDFARQMVARAEKQGLPPAVKRLAAKMLDDSERNLARIRACEGTKK
jgi:hypothetical protein